jgi:competence protein ComEC
MTGLMLVAVLLDRRAISMRSVAWAACAILLVTPEALVGASLQMSFAAVVALVAAYEGTRDYRMRQRIGSGPLRRAGLYVAGIALTSVVATLATAPYSVFHFNRLALYGVVANVLAVPLTGLWVMPWAVAAFLLMPFGLEGLALTPMSWGVEGIIEIAERVAGWPGAVLLVPVMPLAGLAAITLGGLWLCLWAGRWRLLGLVAIAAGIATIAFVRSPDILVHEEARLVAVKDSSGALLLSSSRAARTDGETWLRRAGQEQGGLWPQEGYSPDGQLSCDSIGCLYRRAGHVVAIAWEPEALVEDCREADIVISAEPVRGACPSAQAVIDRFDLWREGSHAIWLDPGEVRIESVRDTRGARPWVAGLPGRKEGSVAPQQPDQPALDANAVRPEDAGLVGGVGGLESD